MKKQLGEFCKTQECETCALCQFECTHDGEDFHIPDDQLVSAYETVFSSAPSIKDSGERRQFDTGAVRDIQEGKGRCDLMPLDVVAQALGGRRDEKSYDAIIDDIDLFQQTGDVEGLYYAVTKFAQAVYGNTCTMLLEVAKHFEDGAKKYNENNWKLGINTKHYIDSGVRHYLKYLRGDKDEPHDRAFCWNILCAIWTCKHKPELNDYKKEETEA